MTTDKLDPKKKARKERLVARLAAEIERVEVGKLTKGALRHAKRHGLSKEEVKAVWLERLEKAMVDAAKGL